MAERTVYLDHSATTGVHPDVLAAMLPYLGAEYGNPSSLHHKGQAARRAVDAARAQVAEFLHCHADEVVFTGSGTESINLALKGIAKARPGTGHIITSAIEHHAVIHTVEQLEREGYTATYLPVSPDGIVDPTEVRAALRPDTRLISVMYANNEVGTIQPVREIAALAAEAGIPFHTDAVQAAGSLPLDVEALGVSALSLSGHKFYAPKGIGLLYLKRGVHLAPQTQGGGQENGRRSGTENVPYIVGVAAALQRAQRAAADNNERWRAMRDDLFERITRTFPDARINGDRQRRLPMNVHVSFRGVEAQSILMGLDMKGICVSSGSACVSAALDPSHVLAAMSVPAEYLYGALRITFGEATTEEHLDYLMECLQPIIRRLQALSPLADPV